MLISMSERSESLYSGMLFSSITIKKCEMNGINQRFKWELSYISSIIRKEMQERGRIMPNKSFYFKKGPHAVLLFHAFSSTPNDVRTIGRALERENYTVYAPAFSGHGTDEPEDVLGESVDQWHKDAKAAYERLKTDGYESIAAFGLSMGGIMAINLIEDLPIIGGGSFSSPLVPTEKTNVPENFWLRFKAQKEKNGETQVEIEEKQKELAPKLSKILNDLQVSVKEMETNYAKIEKPIFIAQGGLDEMIDPELAFQFAESLPNAKVDFHWYEKGVHAITVGDYSKELQTDILAFLERLDWNGGTI